MEQLRRLAAKWHFRESWGWDMEEPPSDAARDALFRTLLLVANGDGVVSAKEREWIVGRAAVSGGSSELIETLQTSTASGSIRETLALSVEAMKSTRTVLYLAIQAAIADGEYASAEKEVVRVAAKTLEVPEQIVSQIEELIEEERALKAKRVKLCFPQGSPF